MGNVTLDTASIAFPISIPLDREHNFTNASNDETFVHPPPENWLIILYTGILFVGVLINLMVLCTITTLSKRKRKRPANILVGHLSTIAILFAFLSVLLLAESVKIVDLSGYGMCELVSFSKSTLLGIFSLNIVSIIFERFRRLRSFHRKLLTYRMIVLIWMFAIILSIPTVLMITYTHVTVPDHSINDTSEEKGSCKSVQLFGLFGATILYELARFIIFHVVVVVYMIYAMCKIRSKLAHLYILKPIPNERMRRKVQNIRFIYIHFMVFIFVWLPFGFLAFTHRVLNRKSADSSNKIPILLKIIGLLLYVYLVLNPLIYLCLVEDLIGRWGCRKKRTENPHVPVNQIKHKDECNENSNKRKDSSSKEDNVAHIETEIKTRQNKPYHKCNEKHQTSRPSSNAELHTLEMSRLSTFNMSTEV